MSKRLAIIGASALGRQLAHQASIAREPFEVVGFFDDFAKVGGDVLGSVDASIKMYNEGAFDYLVIGIGYKAMEFRAACVKRFLGHIPFANIVLPGAFIDPSAQVEEGAVMLTGTMIDQDVKVGVNCFFSLGCSISHETIVGANSYFAPRVTVCGRCRVGENCFLGAGCVVKDGIDVVDGVTIGAGAVVVKNITESGVYVGSPARIMKQSYRKSL